LVPAYRPSYARRSGLREGGSASAPRGVGGYSCGGATGLARGAPYCAPSRLPPGRDHAPKGRACGALAGQPSVEKKWEWVSP